MKATEMRRKLCRLLLATVVGSTGAHAWAADWYTGATPAQSDESWIVAVDASVSVTSNSSQFAGVTGVESEEVGLSPFLRPLAQTARAVFPQAAFLCSRLP